MLLKISHTTHVILIGVYKSVVNEIDHNRAKLVHRACVTLIQRNGQQAFRENAKPESRNPGSSLYLFEYYYSRYHTPSFLGHVVVTN